MLRSVLVSVTTSRSKADSLHQWSNWKSLWLQFVRLSPSLLVSGDRWWRGADKYCEAVLRRRLQKGRIERIKSKHRAFYFDILLFFIKTLHILALLRVCTVCDWKNKPIIHSHHWFCQCKLALKYVLCSLFLEGKCERYVQGIMWMNSSIDPVCLNEEVLWCLCFADYTGYGLCCVVGRLQLVITLHMHFTNQDQEFWLVFTIASKNNWKSRD